MLPLGNRSIGLSVSGEFPGVGVLTATRALEAASSGLQFSSAQTWLSCVSPLLKGVSANGNLHTHFCRIPGSRLINTSLFGLQGKTILPVLEETGLPGSRVSDCSRAGSIVGMHPRCNHAVALVEKRKEVTGRNYGNEQIAQPGRG